MFLKQLVVLVSTFLLTAGLAIAQTVPNPQIADNIEKNISAALAKAQSGVLEAYWEIHKKDSFGNPSVHKRLTTCKAVASENWVFTTPRCAEPKHDYTSILLEKAVFKTKDGQVIPLTQIRKQLSVFYMAFARKENSPFQEIQLGDLHTEWHIMQPNQKEPNISKTFDLALLVGGTVYVDSIALTTGVENNWQLKKAFFKPMNGNETIPMNTSFTYTPSGWGLFSPLAK